MLNFISFQYIHSFFLCRCYVVSLLTEYNLEFPEQIQSKLNNFVVPPGDKSKRRLLKHFPSKTQKQCLQLSPELTVTQLAKLVDELRSFLSPLLNNLDTIIFFRERPKTVMFNTYLRYFLHRENKTRLGTREPHDHLSALSNAVRASLDLINKVLKGEATYGEIIVAHNLDLNAMDIDAEFASLIECLGTPVSDPSQDGIKCMLKLMQFSEKYFDGIVEVLNQYHLEKCLSDPDLLQVTELVRLTRNKEEFQHLTATSARDKWYELQCLLRLHDAKLERLELFDKVADCAEFYRFLEEKNFVGPECAKLFRQQLDLISQQLETDHDMMVMNHLYASISFIAPFVYPNQNFGGLMMAVSTLDYETGLSQLDTVRRKMHLVYFWFSKTQVSAPYI